VLIVSFNPCQVMADICPYFDLWRGRSYSNDSSQALQYFTLGPAVQKLLELARGQFFCTCSPHIAGVVGGLEGKVASC
jgi:hypothetical protein